MSISVFDESTTTSRLNETSEWNARVSTRKFSFGYFFFFSLFCLSRLTRARRSQVKKSLRTESIPLLLSQAERQFDGDDSDCFLSSDDMTPFKKHNIYYKSRWARASSLLFCGWVDQHQLTRSPEWT